MILEKFKGKFSGGIDTSDNTLVTPLFWMGFAITLLLIVALMMYWLI